MVKFSLDAIRINCGYSVEEASKLLGIHRQTLYKYEKDSTKIPFSLLANMEKLYKMPTDYIFLGDKYDLIRTLRGELAVS